MSDHLAAKPDQASSAAPLAVNLTAVHHQLEGWKSEFGAAFLLARAASEQDWGQCGSWLATDGPGGRRTGHGLGQSTRPHR